MRRYERAKFLERLCELRHIYTLRGDDDRTSVISIDEAIRLASVALEAETARDLSSQQPA